MKQANLSTESPSVIFFYDDLKQHLLNEMHAFPFTRQILKMR